MLSRSLLLPLGLFVLLSGCRFPRDDDELEDNDTLETATVLVANTPIEARCNQGDKDVFRFDCPRTGTLVFRIEHRGLEELPSFTVTAPDGRDVYRDGSFITRRRARPELIEPRARMDESTDGIYQIRVAPAEPGPWFLTIEEMGAADNHFLFAWDYRVSASVE